MTRPHKTATTVGPAPEHDEVLETLPGLAMTYVTGITGPLLGARTDPTAGFERSYRVNDVGVQPDLLVDYQRMFHLAVGDDLPLGFIHVLGFPLAAALMARRDFPLPLAGMVHTSNVVESYRSITREDHVDIRAFAQDFRAHKRGTAVNLVVEVGQQDAVWWRGTSTYLAKGIRMDEPDESATEPGESPTELDAGLEGGRTASGKKEDFVPPTPTARWQLDAGTGRRYAALSGDRNPIHLSALSARPFGFKRAIAHGMYTAARALSAVTPLPPVPLRWSTEFHRPVFLPGTVDLAVARGSDEETTYTAWKAGSRDLHLTGEVVAL